MDSEKFDIIIVGSGFTGSIAALALKNSGFRVCLIEKGQHPRFAIGESSTPVADMILRSLSDEYNLPFLKSLSRYGSWRETYPEILCGLKRGFSYFKHRPGELFESDTNHSAELFVAASRSDHQSDTHWFREDTDAFLMSQAREAGIPCFEKTQITKIWKKSGNLVELETRTDSGGGMPAEPESGKAPGTLVCEWIIDATGGPGFSETQFGTTGTSEGFKTNSFALFSHFRNVHRWSRYLNQDTSRDYPFDPDHSALHHLTEEGWMWKLRFENELVSAGFVIDRAHPSAFRLEQGDKEEIWRQLLSSYPSIERCFRDARLAPHPGRILRSGRLQRKLNRTFGENWIALNHTAGFVDPLHSTGIAHSLSGLERLLRIFRDSGHGKENIRHQLESHQSAFYKELELIDLLVYIGYRSRFDFDLFHACSMLYFSLTVSYEQARISGAPPDHFLLAGDPAVLKMVRRSAGELDDLPSSPPADRKSELIKKIRKRIEPFNHANLLDPDKRNMYQHTAVSFNPTPVQRTD